MSEIHKRIKIDLDRIVNLQPITSVNFAVDVEKILAENERLRGIELKYLVIKPKLESCESGFASLSAENKLLREALEKVLEFGRGSSGRIIIEQHQEEFIRKVLQGIEENDSK